MKKIITILVIVLVVCSMTGCGENYSSSSALPTKETENIQAPTEVSVPTIANTPTSKPTTTNNTPTPTATNTPTPTATNTPTPEPTATPTATNTPIPQEIIITTENWNEYFECVNKETWNYDAFGDFKDINISQMFMIKEEYKKRIASNTVLAFKIETDYGRYKCDIDSVNKIFTLKEPIDVSTREYTFKVQSSGSYGKLTPAFSSLNPSGEGYIIWQWDDNIRVTRVEGVIYLKE